MMTFSNIWIDFFSTYYFPSCILGIRNLFKYWHFTYFIVVECCVSTSTWKNSGCPETSGRQMSHMKAPPGGNLRAHFWVFSAIFDMSKLRSKYRQRRHMPTCWLIMRFGGRLRSLITHFGKYGSTETDCVCRLCLLLLLIQPDTETINSRASLSVNDQLYMWLNV